jgi:MerR family redox-sensitive transcriptional activator SoxR
VSQLSPRHKELTVGQLSARSGVAVSALHFYESKGLISSRRTSGNQRRYTRDTLRRVAFIRASQRVGIPLDTIREALDELPEGRTPTTQDWADMSERWRGELESRIEQLLRLRDTLTGCIGCGCLSLERCALSNPDDVFGKHAAGSLLVPRPRADGEQAPAAEDAATEGRAAQERSAGEPPAAPVDGAEQAQICRVPSTPGMC